MRFVFQKFIAVCVLLELGLKLCAQDIVLNDFESTTFTPWATAGTAFGAGPVTNAVSGQSPVTGFLGSRFADSFNGGDASTGALTSPPFSIQRNYIRFLIGGGNQRGQTCINLIVNGQIVRSAVGMGDREDLSWLQWNVSDLLGSSGTLQVMDSNTGGWGHINVDQIVESNSSLTNVFTASQRYLNLPISFSEPSHLVELVRDGLVEHEFNIQFTTNANPDFYAFLDLAAYQGKDFLVRVDSQPASAGQLAALIQSTNIIAATPIYQETLRPIYHYSARRGFINDPNGMVFYNGEYHLAYQHNPYGLDVGNQHWGNAVSTDLVHWTELPESIYPDWRGQAWSGSSVVDWNNTAGFGSNAIVSFYTAAGGHDNNPRMSLGQRFTQCLAYSLDSDRTLTKYANNPVLPNVVGDNRDPRVICYAPGNKWVMVLWLQNNDFGFFSSTDLKHWTQTSTFSFPPYIEVPELFQLALDGDPNNLKWILYVGAGNYYVGAFDGNSFTPENGPFSIRGGNSFAAAQTFNNIPASDGRRILIANGTQNYPNMPFNCAMTFPVELTLATYGGLPMIRCNPVRELSLLRTSTNTWPSQALSSGVNLMSGTTGEAFELDSSFQPGSASKITFTLRGTTVVYDNVGRQVSCRGINQPLNPIGGVVRLQMLVDRGSLEIFGNGGLLYMSMGVTPTAGAQAVSLVATGNGAQLVSQSLYNLGSAWTSAATNPPPGDSPVISVQPMSVTNIAGMPVSFSVVATGAAPLTYAWRFNGSPLVPTNNVPSVTNATLNLLVTGLSDAGLYDVIIGNSAGSVTSSPAALSFVVPVITGQPSPVTANLGGPAGFSVTASGSSLLSYQWRSAGVPITGATNSSLNLFPVNLSSATNYDVVVSAGALSVTSSVALLTLRPPYIVSRWPMEAQTLTPNTAGSLTFNGVQDLYTNPGQGIVAVGTVVPAARDDLITFSSLPGNPVVLSNSVPPAALFANGNSPGAKSFNAGAYSGGDGALFFPQDQYGNEFSFNSPFSVELFFKTYGDQSAAGKLQLVMQGESSFRYGIVMNEPANGSVEFVLTNRSTGRAAIAALTNANYADGQWHYLLAVYDTLSGSNGQARLTVVNTNGEECSVVTDLAAGFGALPSGNDGNLFLGRFKYPIAQEHRTFLGLLDEVQVTAGVVSDAWRLGTIPSIDSRIQITSALYSGTNLFLEWTSAAGQSYAVQWAGQLGDLWQVIANVPGSGAIASFSDTNAARLSQPAGFYRIAR
ncbi:MAG: GH32 C-terminal domain-containing protein [Verrucomicrobiota bacterium]